jgi:hypothetical protein
MNVALVIPTGVGAEFGGYAGDAGPVVKLFSGIAERLLVHPNVVNAASLFAGGPPCWYVEGGLLDAFMTGRLALTPPHARRVGLLLDRALAPDRAAVDHLMTAADAVRAVHGVRMVGAAWTPRPVGARVSWHPSGASWGELPDPDALLEGARSLLEAGAEAIAVVTRMPELDPIAVEAYLAGQGADPIGGIEALISRVLTLGLGVPAAHAPYEGPDGAERVDPRVAAEHVGYTYLPCILQGLAWCPAPVPTGTGGAFHVEALDALVVPSGCLGGPAVLACLERGIPVVAVDSPVRVNGPASGALRGEIVRVTSHLEAAGVLVALRAGLALDTLRRPLAPLAFLD